MHRLPCIALALIGLTGVVLAGDSITVQGSVSVAIPIQEAARVLEKERDLTVNIGVTGGGTGGLSMLGQGHADVAMINRAITLEDKAGYPACTFTPTQIGAEVVVIGVAQDVWAAGVHALTPDQLRSIYEGTIKNWKAVGGPDEKIQLFIPPEGRGMWETFVQWLYGEIRKAPSNQFPPVATDEDARDILEFTPGSVALLSPKYVDAHSIYALGIQENNGHIVVPDAENFSDGKYPMLHPLFLVTNDEPTLAPKVLVDFMLSDRGQGIMKKSGMVPLKDLKPQ